MFESYEENMKEERRLLKLEKIPMQMKRKDNNNNNNNNNKYINLKRNKFFLHDKLEIIKII